MGLFTELARRPATVEESARTPRPASALGARFPRRARRARLPAARRRPLRQHAGDRSVSRPATSRRTSAASSRWRTTACIRSGATSPRRCAPASRRTRSRPAARRCSTTLYADPARLKQFLPAMTGISHGANMTIAREVPVEGIPHVRRRRHGAGRSRRAGRAGQPAPHGHRASTCRRSRRSSRSTSRRTACATALTFRRGRLLQRTRCRRPTS